MVVKTVLAMEKKLLYVIHINALSTESTVIGTVGLNVPKPVEADRRKGLDNAIIHHHSMEGKDVPVSMKKIHHATAIHAQWMEYLVNGRHGLHVPIAVAVG
jgi:hypothetical protein